jgi:hypothetical protein
MDAMLWLSLLIPPMMATLFYIVGHFSYSNKEKDILSE